ncbi:hypothetical protein I3843_08G016400 [Carya illinoinensis]|uniref:CUE domain-containing protein n=1 Tax=Carya illinoinensis TaxID=32201 RepID=A0A8T1PRF1_CARIL|nr:polyadenylate-binding protein-interacting protein 5-like isoform X2 [Carya illinoinensis]XP_042939123.1 polyadenylate-binding protein-interacting protein 5-like isoform X2 [Carya illinoinensis]KAG6643857.1 hypothetical protein CIPAW_08G015700 [Carya illinoinensis]KAG6643858.1 hypothetical protein CIPAW_08G015700 [Carya illinoinensis]KAG7965765.1 hypothetical protein I3843_08G016400 [Carya illinoinensis]KAG7965766.1 hypothetical protein I3843_08G016400 [Carya illinoinensis]
MKPSSLNPYAESYIPLSKRDANDSTYVTARVSKIDNECVQFGGPVQLHHKASIDSKSHGTEKVPSPEVFTLKSQPVHAYVPSAQNVNQVTDKQISDEEYDMDLEYLQMSFPGISVQSLTDVYLANKGDLDATMDMLNQLEFYSLETSEILPDTLDIGDVSEFGSSVDCASLKLKNIGGEANAASSSSKGSVTIS